MSLLLAQLIHLESCDLTVLDSEDLHVPPSVSIIIF